ncbi:hypothetical protein [Jiangella asiatica]|uniref:Uncharacterized protein n=1 Tax=Jiangella asiatica TaxID=2530372 RepID=A0A4R5CFL2_9ACTN|nr:hypothetical protein [Jiangella asiatica]TDD96024.1 hypothetical protein E1269_30765 [Jiangella asiatica]
MVVAVGASCAVVVGALIMRDGAPAGAPLAGGLADVASTTTPTALSAATPTDLPPEPTRSPYPRGSPTVAPGQDTPSPSDGARDGWTEAARGFGQAFTHTEVGRDAWFAAMSTWLTPQQADRYREVPVEDVPGGVLRDVSVEDPSGGTITRGRLTYDTGMILEVGLSFDDSAGGWLVARVTLADPSG